MDHEDRRVSEALDPLKFIEHTTRTALLLEQLARDVKDLRDRVGSIDSVRLSLSTLERDCALRNADLASQCAANRRMGEGTDERLRWLSRLVVGTFITGGIGGLVALLWRAVG